MKKARPGKKRRERRPAKSRAARGGGTADGPGPALCSDGERKRPAKNDCGRMPPCGRCAAARRAAATAEAGPQPRAAKGDAGAFAPCSARSARRPPPPRALVPGGRNRRKAWAPPPVLRCRAIKSRLSRRARRRIASQRGAGKHRGKPSPAQGLDVERPQSGQGDKKWRRAVFRFAAQSCKGRSVGRLHGAASSVCPRCAPRSRAPACPHAAASSCPRRTSRLRAPCLPAPPGLSSKKRAADRLYAGPRGDPCRGSLSPL